MPEKKINKLFIIIPGAVIAVIFFAAVYYKFVYLQKVKTVPKKNYVTQKLLAGTALKIKGYKRHPIQNFKKFFKSALVKLDISKTDIIKRHIVLNIKAPVNLKNKLKKIKVSFLKYDILVSKNAGFGPIENIFASEFKKFIIPSKADLKYYSYSVKNNCLCLYFYFKSRLFLKALFIVKGAGESGFTSIKDYADSPKIALDIDDVGYRRSYINSLISLKTPITFAIFPYAPYSKDLDLKLHRLGYETIMHTPMEPVDTALFPGDGALFISMDKKEIKRKIFTDLSRLPYIDGANNHEGSLFTSDEKKICAAVSDFKKKGLFFVDSLTDNNSYAYRCALLQGIPSAQRDVFIDDKPADGYIENQLKTAAALADKFKRVIVIGHPRRDTVKTLMSEIPALKKEGYKFVPLCEFLR